MKRKNGESGFALLLVFVMAAAIAITLYMEVPRIAFESQRTREQMAIDHALQYKRAIQLFYRKYQTYPQTLDDLETTRNIRFLRFRYLDPLTGKPWRLLHVGPAGQLTDSLVQPPAPLPGSSNGSNSSNGNSLNASGNSAQNGTGTAQSSNPNQTGDPNNPSDPNNPNAQPPDPLNMAARRPSDRIIGGPGGVAGGAPSYPPGGDPALNDQSTQEPDPNQPQQPQQPVQAGTDPNNPQNPGQPQIPGQQQTAGEPGAPPNPANPAQPPVGFPPGLLAATGATPNQAANPGQSSNPQQPLPGEQIGLQPGQVAQQQAGQAGAAGAAGQQQSAANLIQQILTTPRQPPSAAGFTTGSTGGIAGVASTAEGKGIHLINDRSKYKEWEFVYDVKKDKTVVGAAAVNAQTQVQQQMQNGANGLGTSPFSSGPGSSPFGSSTTSTGSSPTGSAATPAPTTPPPTQ